MSKNIVQWRIPENFLVGSMTAEPSRRIQFMTFSLNHTVHGYA